MTKLVDFSAKRQKKLGKSKLSPKPPEAEVVRLWRFSLSIDELIREGVLEENLEVAEIAAVLAHRLAHLIATHPSHTELADFCQHIISREVAKNATDNKTG